MEVRTLEHKDIEKTVAPEEVVSVNFIEAIINKDNDTLSKLSSTKIMKLVNTADAY